MRARAYTLFYLLFFNKPPILNDSLDDCFYSLELIPLNAARYAWGVYIRIELLGARKVLNIKNPACCGQHCYQMHADGCHF